MDLLEHAQRLVARGGSAHHSHMVALKSIIQQEKPAPAKPILKTEQPNQSQVKSRNPNLFYLIGGLVLIVSAVLAIGYWLGKSKSQKEFDF